MGKGLMAGVPQIVNGDSVIGLTSSKRIKTLGWADLSTVYAWYHDAPEERHLGMITTFETMTGVPMPKYKDFFAKGKIIEVNGMQGSFTYDVPIKKSTGCYTVGDTSAEAGDCPGIDGGIFPIELDMPYQPGDVITSDALYGQQVIVSEDETVEQHGDYWRHWVKLVTMDAAEYYDGNLLKPGIEYFKIGHNLGEFSQKFSNFSGTGNSGTMKLEFNLGNHRGVETFYSMYADKKQVSGAGMEAKQHWDYFTGQIDKLGKDKYGNTRDMFYVGKKNSAKKLGNNTLIGATLEWMVVDELMRLEAHQLMFQRAGIIRDINGTKRLNEGIWHQRRRGRIIKYAKPGGITKNHMRQAAAYLFKNRRDLLPADRRMKFECGYHAYVNILGLFSDEVNRQLENVSRFLGTDRSIPNSPISGKDLMNLEMTPIRFTKVNIPELGIVEIEHDSSLDYMPLADRSSQGFYGDGYAWTTYSMVIRDMSDSSSSNALTNLPSGVTLKNPTYKGSEAFYVKPTGEHFYWGFEQGRYSPAHRRAGGIASSMRYMGQAFWAHSTSAGWVPDVSASLCIELKR